MSDRKPLQTLTVAVDIDGVIAPVITPEMLISDPDAERPWPVADYLVFDDVMFGTVVAAPVRELLIELDQHPLVTPMWHSSWRENATEELAPALGVGTTWPQFATQDEYRHPEVWWKLQAIERWIAEHEGQPEAHLLWLDDDTADALASGEIPAELAQHPQLTIIAPEVFTALTPTHLRTIRDLLRRLP